MTPELRSLVESSFYVAYNLNMSPLEVDKLSTYEMREYIDLLMKKKSAEQESDTTIFKSIFKLFGIKKKL